MTGAQSWACCRPGCAAFQMISLLAASQEFEMKKPVGVFCSLPQGRGAFQMKRGWCILERKEGLLDCRSSLKILEYPSQLFMISPTLNSHFHL